MAIITHTLAALIGATIAAHAIADNLEPGSIEALDDARWEAYYGDCDTYDCGEE